MAYVSSYVSSQSHTLPPANCLPLSGFSYPPRASTGSRGVSQQQGSASYEGGTWSKASAGEGLNALTQFRKPFSISSLFVALSGSLVCDQEDFRSCVFALPM